MTYATKNRTEQGGERTVIGGALDIEGGTLCVGADGTPLTRLAVIDRTITVAAVQPQTVGRQIVTGITGVQPADVLVGVSVPAVTLGLAFAGGRITGTETVTLDWSNPTATTLAHATGTVASFTIARRGDVP